MEKTMELLEFYPTPRKLLNKMFEGVNLYKVHTILEPSAGKGDIVKYIEELAQNSHSKPDIDCIELDPTLQNTLLGAGYRLVHDDFLTFRTFKQYDLIAMNPPFSNGAEHLMKALSMQKEHGGAVFCILNAETIKNPYSSIRKTLIMELKKANATIEYRTDEFKSAERKTDVEIALIKVFYERPEYKSDIFDGLKRKYYKEYEESQQTDLATTDFIEMIVKSYELDVEAGIRLIEEYKALQPRLMPNIDKQENTYAHPMLELTCDGELNVNSFVKKVRAKYWHTLFADKRITGTMTSKLRESYQSQVDELSNYDFSTHNIYNLRMKMSKELIGGIEECIINLFDTLSYEYSWNEGSENIHYYNGWSTNRSWYINKKVILPCNAYSPYSGKFSPDYHVKQRITDIEKALNYLDGGLTDGEDVSNRLKDAEKQNCTKNIDTKFLTLTFYKKGTCHIVFKDLELLKKLNIFGSQQKGWLPPSYGKKDYESMNAEEKAVIDNFEGKESYKKVMSCPNKYILNTSNLLLLEGK